MSFSYVFPTHVGVFLRERTNAGLAAGLPHARGGVSGLIFTGNFLLRSSPRTWGCFKLLKNKRKRVTVFPTHVGVFPYNSLAIYELLGLPHARGGVSY